MRDSGLVPFRFPFRAAALAAAFLAAIPGAMPAAAQSAERGSSDAATYAEMMGVSLSEARRRLALQLELGKLETRLREQAPDNFAGLWIEHQPSFTVQLRFKDVAAGERLLRSLGRSAADGELAVGRAEASLAELERLQQLALDRARAAGLAVDADLDLRENRVEIATTAPEEAARLLNEPSLAAGRIAVLPVAALAQPLQTYVMRGGRPLSSCSSAFTARNANGSVGVLTAGHCDDAQSDLDFGPALPYVAGQLSGSRDVQFHSRTCQHDVLNQFDSGTGIRQVTGTLSRDQQVVGSMVCRYGKSTPQRCGLIHSKNTCPSYVASCSSTFVRIASTNGQALATFGDSGGPVFFDTLAYGIISGGYPNSPDVFYMPINYASPIAEVLTLNGGPGYVTGTLSCSGVFNGSTQINCNLTAAGGVPPYTYWGWFYNGDADFWSTSWSSIRATYLTPGCPGGAHNYFAVNITDSCGTAVGGATAYQTCPQGCAATGGGAGSDDRDSLLPPVCSLAPND